MICVQMKELCSLWGSEFIRESGVSVVYIFLIRPIRE